jgi:trans-2,3-dihydro-3-hydroxyanthranilate isomerase
MEFYIVDVFAEGKYSGNQLAVFVCRSIPADAEMQQIAREINFSESAFILSDREAEGGWPVRIFTPASEVDFAGHPTLGTADVIRRRLLPSSVRAQAFRLSLRLKAGSIPVEFSTEKDAPVWMEQIPPCFGDTLPAAALAEALSLPAEAIDGRFPIQQVSTGLPHILVPLRSLDSLRRAKVDKTRYFGLIEKTWAKNILVFCLQGRTESHDISVRMFADILGIAEDPATGSGNGCLAGYLVKHRCLGTDSIDIVSGQGHEIGRPSLLFLQAAAEGEDIRVRVGGRVFEVASGAWGEG